MRYCNFFGVYDLTELPGCPQVAVSHNVFIKPQHRGYGKGKRQHVERLEMINQLGFNYVICTVAANNPTEKHILELNGWKKLDQFHSSRSDNDIEIWGRLMP